MKGLVLVLLVCLAAVACAVSKSSHHHHTKKRGHIKNTKKHFLGPLGIHPLIKLANQCQTKDDCTKINPKTYCQFGVCVDCLKENVVCTQNGQCCDTTECVYGRCKKAAKGDPGTFCDKKEDCKAPDQCCVREPGISMDVSICKPQLDENVHCGPVNDFRVVQLTGAFQQTVCPPCKESLKLECRAVGNGGYHVCQKPAK